MLEPKRVQFSPQLAEKIGEKPSQKGDGVTGGRDIGGTKPNFFKALGNVIARPFVAFSKAIASLGHKPGPAPTLSPKTQAALDHLAQLRKTAETQPNSVSKDDLKAAREQAKKAMLEELRGSDVYQAALNDGRSDVFSCMDKGYISDSPQRTLEEAVDHLLHADRLDKFRASGLSVAEGAAIHTYTKGAYVAINDEIRRGKDHETPLMCEMRKAIESGFDKLPPYKPTNPKDHGMIYRLANIPSHLDDNYRVGKKVSDPGIMSTTRNDEFNYDAGNQSHVLTIKPKEDTRGRDVSWLSLEPQEGEVLFPPGTPMKVVKRDTADTPQWQQKSDNFDKQVGLVLIEV